VVKVPEKLEQMLNDPSLDYIRVSNGFDNLHPLAANTREYISKTEPAEGGLINVPSEWYLSLIASREQADRAIPIMDAILKEWIRGKSSDSPSLMLENSDVRSVCSHLGEPLRRETSMHLR
jgi:hypothetical protein